jgi:hypothetical protein
VGLELTTLVKKDIYKREKSSNSYKTCAENCHGDRDNMEDEQ